MVMITSEGTTDSTSFADGAILLRAFLADENTTITNKPLAELRANYQKTFIVAAIKRETKFFVATGNTEVQTGDTIYTLLEKNDLDSFVEHFHFKSTARRVIVYGATKLGVKLCQGLEKQTESPISDLILIDQCDKACESASESLSSTSIIKGSPFEKRLLSELKTENSDYFISLSDNDEGNLAAALMAKRLGARTTITLTSQPEYVEIFEPLPHIDAVVSPIFLCVGSILKLVRSGRVHSLSMIAGRRGEAIEVEVMEDAPIAGKTVKEIDFPAGMVLAAILDSDGASLPDGNTSIEVGQRVISVVMKDTVTEAMKLFGI